MITYLIEMLNLQSHADMTTSTMQSKSSDKILLVTSWAKIMAS